ncbi:desulfoferrodoxin FeS4 iron-binding domain-containing protein [bacterium]|nr:desulfoferrodoxin FeS4 iron-binding domain-containing protein [bacterium]
MTEILELYKCNICGNLVEVIQNGQGELICCGKPMEQIKTNNSDMEELNDKHVPVIEKVVDGYTIRIGSTKHPMTEEHHINFIQAISKDNKYIKTKFLSVEEEPELSIKCKCEASLWARALCNIHGLFKKEFEE